MTMDSMDEGETLVVVKLETRLERMVREGAARTIRRAGTSRWGMAAGLAVLFLVLCEMAMPSVIRSTVKASVPLEAMGHAVPRVPGFERFIEFEEEFAQRRASAAGVECGQVAEPAKYDRLPSWVSTPAEMAADSSVEEVVSGVYAKGGELAITQCTYSVLAVLRDYIEPASSPESGETDPNWDIYFACGSGSKIYTISIMDRISIGRVSRAGRGTYRLIAPHHNVILDGRKKNGIIRIEQHAHLTVYGLTFRNGRVRSTSEDMDSFPSGGYQGGAILVMSKGSLISQKCSFIGNHATSLYARWGGGGAIKAENLSSVIIWSCQFKSNHASVGGAVAASSAVVLYVAQSTFQGNTAHGGLDGSVNNKGRDAPKLLVKGGAVRVDSVMGYELQNEHVLFCNSKFVGNTISLSNAAAEKFGLGAENADGIKAAGAAVTAWNAPYNLNTFAGDHRFLSITSCTFEGNKALIEPQGTHLGQFVFEARGAGHTKLRDVTFTRNVVNGAVAKFDNSDRYADDLEHYTLQLSNVKFRDNGDVNNFAFEPRGSSSMCIFSNVDGVPDIQKDCSEATRGNA